MGKIAKIRNHRKLAKNCQFRTKILLGNSIRNHTRIFNLYQKKTPVCMLITHFIHLSLTHCALSISLSFYGVSLIFQNNKNSVQLVSHLIIISTLPLNEENLIPGAGKKIKKHTHTTNC